MARAAAVSLDTIAGVLDHAAEHGLNVLLEGKHGIGKTALIKQCFDKRNINWHYFSASTIDPWIDLVGVPKEKNGKLELIRPANLDYDNLEAIFLDEYNRAPKKVRNAVMELIQFGSINGKKFPKLRMVWVAINPDDDETGYDVDKLDPAQLDRFDLQIPLPYLPCKAYFTKSFGHLGELAYGWWTDQKPNVQELVSPRRLEKILNMHLLKGDISYIINPQKINVTELRKALSAEDPVVTLGKLKSKSESDKRKFFRDNNEYKRVKTALVASEEYLGEFLHLIPEAEFMSSIRNKKGNAVVTYVVKNFDKYAPRLAPAVLGGGSTTNYPASIVKACETWQSANGVALPRKKKGRPTEVDILGVATKVKDIKMLFTGTLSKTRPKMQKRFTDLGGTTASSMSFQVTHVVVGKSPGASIVAAKKQNCVIMNEAEFNSMIQQLDPKAALTSKMVDIKGDGNMVDITGLTLDNYDDRVGQRFRREKWDIENGVSREAAFRNFMAKHDADPVT